MAKFVRTGAVRPCRTEDKITIEVIDVGENDFVDRYVASVYGWKRNYATGQGSTIDRAIKDWCEATGNSLKTVLAECRLIDEEGLEIVLAEKSTRPT